MADLLFFMQYETIGTVHITLHCKYLYLSKHYGGLNSKLLHIHEIISQNVTLSNNTGNYMLCSTVLYTAISVGTRDTV